MMVFERPGYCVILGLQTNMFEINNKKMQRLLLTIPIKLFIKIKINKV
jgi:hypothetical protein